MLHCKDEHQIGTRACYGCSRISAPIDGNPIARGFIRHPSLPDISKNLPRCRQRWTDGFAKELLETVPFLAFQPGLAHRKHPLQCISDTRFLHIAPLSSGEPLSVQIRQGQAAPAAWFAWLENQPPDPDAPGMFSMFGGLWLGGGPPCRLSWPRRQRLMASPRMRVASCGAWKPIEFSDITKSIMN